VREERKREEKRTEEKKREEDEHIMLETCRGI